MGCGLEFQRTALPMIALGSQRVDHSIGHLVHAVTPNPWRSPKRTRSTFAFAYSASSSSVRAAIARSRSKVETMVIATHVAESRLARGHFDCNSTRSTYRGGSENLRPGWHDSAASS